MLKTTLLSHCLINFSPTHGLKMHHQCIYATNRLPPWVEGDGLDRVAVPIKATPATQTAPPPKYPG